jgi:hypothetical protein
VIRLGTLNSSSAAAEPASSTGCDGNSGRGAASGTITATGSLLGAGAGARQPPQGSTLGIAVDEIETDTGERRFQLVDIA